MKTSIFTRSLLILSHLLIVEMKPLPKSLSHEVALNSSMADSQSPDSSNVDYQLCSSTDYKIRGKVLSLNIYPCQRLNPSDPCTFHYGRNYTIEIVFVSELDSTNPRSSVVADDEREGPYAYSGQSFSGCNYTPCPIKAQVKSVYTYDFHTLNSSFDHLTFNVTDSFLGPSLFCAGADVKFQR